MCLIGNSTHETEEIHVMQTPSRQRHRLFSWRSALATCLLFRDAIDRRKCCGSAANTGLSRLDSRQGLCRGL